MPPKITSAVIDLDGARAARAEAAGKAPVIKFGGTTYDLPNELPADFALFAAEQDLRGAVFALLGDEQATAFFAWRPSMDDLKGLVDGAMTAYGAGPGESDASPST